MIYGHSWTTDNQYIIAFESVEQAMEWLETEEYDFRSREILNTEKARTLMGWKFDEWDETCKCYF